MHKLILSIIAVACLQIGFITYVTTDQTGDNTRLTGIGKQPVNSATSPDYMAEDEGIEVATLDEDPFFRLENDGFTNAKSARFAKVNYEVRRKNTRLTRKVRTQHEPFEPQQVIITYAVHKPYKFAEREPYKNVSIDTSSIVNKPENAEQPVMKPQKPDGNPILNVIKKPYGWIKALGSKLK